MCAIRNGVVDTAFPYLIRKSIDIFLKRKEKEVKKLTLSVVTALCAASAHSAQIFEWNAPGLGNQPAECSATQTFTSGSLVKYLVECPDHVATISKTISSGSTCTFGAETSGYYVNSTNCNNWRVHTNSVDRDGRFEEPSYIVGKGLSGLTWRYTTTNPGANWEKPSFNVSSWSAGKGGFYDGSNSVLTENTTAFLSNLWLRADFTLTSSQIDSLMFWAVWDDSVEIYVNGKLAASSSDWVATYRYLGLSDEARKSLVAGTNTLAVKVKNNGGPGYFDMGLVSSKLANLPVSGTNKNAKLAWITDYVKEAMSKAGVPAGAVAITRKNNSTQHRDVVYSAGFGYMDKYFTTPVKHDAVFRLASVDKMFSLQALRRMTDGKTEETYITVGGETKTRYTCNLSEPHKSTAVLNPATGNWLKCNDKVLDILAHYGVVSASTAISVDSRLANVTITDLLHFQDRFVSRPNQQDATELANYYSFLGITSSQSSPENLMRWYFTNPLTANPGDYDKYNSDGVAVARFLVDKLGGGLENYLQNNVLSSSSKKNVYIAHELVNDRVKDSQGNLREPWYLTHSAPFDFWIGLNDAMALSASAETVGMFKSYYGWGRNDGGMAGTQTVTMEFGKDYDIPANEEDFVYTLTWLVSGGGLPFGQEDSTIPNTQYVDSNLRIMLYNLPLSAWSPEPELLTQPSTGMCIHPQSGSNNPTDGTLAVTERSCSQINRLKYEFTSGGSLKQVSSGKCLHPQGGSATPANGTPLVFWAGCDEPRLEFKLDFSGQLKHVSSGKCVEAASTSSGAQLLIQDCRRDKPAQQFDYFRSDANKIVHLPSGKCVTPSGDAVAPSNDTPLIFKAGCGHEASTFNLLPNGMIVHRPSGMCAWPENSSTNPANWTRLVLKSSCSVTSAAQFSISPEGSLKHDVSGKCIHPSGGSSNPSDGTELVFWNSCSGSQIPLSFNKKFQ